VTVTPDATTAIASSRVAREAGQLRLAQRALDRAYACVGADGDAMAALLDECVLLAGALGQAGSRLAALSEWLRALERGAKNAAGAVGVLVSDYDAWRPAPESVGLKGDGLKAAATGTFWVGLGARGRILTLSGGVTAEGVKPFQRVIEMSAQDVQWLLVDMRELTYVGSSALALVVKQAERLRTLGGGLCLYSMSSSLKILVEMLGVNTSVTPVEGLLEALEEVARVRAGA
jgi:anti-anti-sigma factor